MSSIRQFQVKITGKSSLLFHRDNIEFAEQLKAWRQTPSNKKFSVPGDDRSPAFGWIGCLYENGEVVALPQDNIMRCLMEGGAMVPVPGGKNGKTFKAQTQSGMFLHEEFWPLLVNGKSIDMAPFKALVGSNDFAKHQQAVSEAGFSLLVKRAKIGTSKHVRVRPRFDNWSASGLIDVWDDQISAQALTDILSAAGDYKGLGDWRPSSKTPGPYGRFSVEVKEL